LHGVVPAWFLVSDAIAQTGSTAVARFRGFGAPVGLPQLP
jgi:hypothetical protein